MSITLMGVQIYYHYSLYHHSCSKVVNSEGDVRVDAEATACCEASVMEAA